MEKYDRLRNYLRDLDENRVGLTFQRIEEILKDKGPLPASASTRPAWWGNERVGTHTQANAWMDAGWEVDRDGLVLGVSVTFRGPLKTSVFRGFLTLWRKSPYVNSLYYKELRFSPRHL